MIYYFSATGNSLAIAKQIAEKTGDTCTSISRVAEIALTDPVIGIVFPVFYGDVPSVMRDFVRSHHFPKEAYIYSVATCGSSWGRCFFTLRQLLKAQGCDLHYSYVCPLIANSTICMRSHVPYKWDKLKKESYYVQDIAAAVQKKKENHTLEQNSFSSKLMDWGLLKPFFRWYFDIHVEPSRCTKCGQCVRLCPVKNITMGEEAAVMGQRCISCLACLHGCPCQAIKVRNRTILKEDQYRHPGITVKELER